MVFLRSKFELSRTYREFFVFAREKTNSFKESSLVFFKERQMISMYVAVVSMSASELLHTLVPLP